MMTLTVNQLNGTNNPHDLFILLFDYRNHIKTALDLLGKNGYEIKIFP